jgi:hypothetical protein
MRAIAIIFVALMLFCIMGCGDKGVQQEEYVRVTGTVYGRVIDTESGFPIKYRPIEFGMYTSKGNSILLKWSATTDENGEYRKYFCFNGVPPINYVITYSFDVEGYEHYTKKVWFANDSEFRVDIELESLY